MAGIAWCHVVWSPNPTGIIRFCEEIYKHRIELLKIDTVEHLGDIFTKGLPRQTFEYLRKKIMG